MQQKELAALLGVSPAMVSRHVKRGMPADTLERAEKWRRRHLEPGRVKGVRYEPSRTAKPTIQKPASAARAMPCVTVADVEAMADLTDSALARGNQDAAETRIRQLRELLRQLPDDASPRLTLRVWLALVIYLLHEEAEIRHAPDVGALLTPCGFGARVGLGGWPAHVVLFEACDWDDNAINGFPEFPDDSE
jgi:DNA-binding MarR family transcriptional regulator